MTSYLPIYKPFLEDWDSGKYLRCELTSEHLDWNPSDPTFGEQEDDATDDVGSFVDRYAPSGYPNLYIRAISSSVPQSNISDDENLGNVLMNKVQVSVIARAISTAQTTKTGNVTSTQGKFMDTHDFSRRWMIPIDCAKRTVKKASQRRIQKVLHPSSSIRRPTNDRMLQYPRLPYDVFTDTLIAGTVFKRGNKYSQVFGTSFGWTCLYPMAPKGQAHEVLSIIFKRDGVPPTMISNGSK